MKEGDILTAVKKHFTGRKSDVDMTRGGIAGNIILFALPLLAGNLFQQLYNMVDTWVIGQTGNDAAYAAVGSIGPAINLMIGFFMGLSSGAGVVISQYYGAKREDKVRDAVHTSLMMTLILGVVLTIVGVIISPYILSLMLRADSSGESSDAVYENAKMYLTIYFSGVIGLMIYNMCSGILRAVGDSTRPFYFLVAASIINIVLDLLFVFAFDMGVAGVALATIIAQFTSAVLSVIALLRTESCVKLLPKALRIDFSILGEIIRIGIPTALQMALTAFSNMFVQSYISGVNLNSGFGLSSVGSKLTVAPEAMKEVGLAAWTTYSKLDMFIFLPVQSISLAVTTFVAQNVGIGNIKRAKKGADIGFVMGAAANITLIGIVMIFAPFLASVFNSNKEIVHFATILLRWITPFYFFTSINQVYSAALRGAGNSRAPMIIMLSTFVGFRQLYLFVMSNYISNGLLPIAFGYPAGWFACASVTFIYYRFIFKFPLGKGVKSENK